MSIYKLLEKACKKDQNCCYIIIMKFDNLIKKYARKLSYEDAENDLICYFVELIYTFPLHKFNEKDEGRIVSYISNCITNYYYFLLKKLIKHKNEVYMSDLSEEQQYILEARLSVDDNYETLFWEDIQKKLNEKEWNILKCIYLQGLSANEIADECGITRQAVNQAKIRLLAKLKQIYFINSNFSA